MYIKFTIPFGDALALVEGDYFPAQKDVAYNRNGEWNGPPDPEQFYIVSFRVGGIDIYDSLATMYIKKPDGSYKQYIESVWDNILEEARQAYEELLLPLEE